MFLRCFSLQIWFALILGNAAERLTVIYSQELTLKEKIWPEYTRVQDRNMQVVLLSLWIHQPYLEERYNTLLESMLLEVGLRWERKLRDVCSRDLIGHTKDSICLNFHYSSVNTFDSSVGRAEDCRWYTVVILRSLVRIRLEGELTFFFLFFLMSPIFFILSFTLFKIIFWNLFFKTD